MSVSTNIQNVLSAAAKQFDAGDYCGAFDSVRLESESGGAVSIFLPAGTGQAVADAINAAVAAGVKVAA